MCLDGRVVALFRSTTDSNRSELLVLLSIASQYYRHTNQNVHTLFSLLCRCLFCCCCCEQEDLRIRNSRYNGIIIMREEKRKNPPLARPGLHPYPPRLRPEEDEEVEKEEHEALKQEPKPKRHRRVLTHEADAADEMHS